MKIEKKYLVAGAIGMVSVAAGLAYLQYRKLMNYCIGFKSIKLNTATEKNVDFDVFMNLRNNSNVRIEIESQEYNVYLNDKFVTKASNAISQIVAPESLSVVAVNVKFNPTDVFEIFKLNIRDLLLNRDKIKIKVDVKLKVKLWFFSVSIPYVYESNLKEMMTPSASSQNAPKSSGKCK